MPHPNSPRLTVEPLRARPATDAPRCGRLTVFLLVTVLAIRCGGDSGSGADPTEVALPNPTVAPSELPCTVLVNRVLQSLVNRPQSESPTERLQPWLTGHTVPYDVPYAGPQSLPDAARAFWDIAQIHGIRPASEGAFAEWLLALLALNGHEYLVSEITALRTNTAQTFTRSRLLSEADDALEDLLRDVLMRGQTISIPTCIAS